MEIEARQAQEERLKTTRTQTQGKSNQTISQGQEVSAGQVK
jgi:hypothetical protein